MEKLLFIVNPIAGKGRGKKAIPIIEKKMEDNNIPYEIIITSMPLEATRLAKENVGSFGTIIAVGGDGTVNEVAQGLIESRKGRLGIIPCGTGNDFVRALNIEVDIEKSLDAIIEGKIKAIDIGRVNGQHFLNISSIGFDSHTVITTNKIKKRINGMLAYIIGVLITLIKYRKENADLIIGGKEYKRNLLLLAVGNGNTYGGGMKLLPMAKIDDGYFHICIVRDVSNLKLLFLFPSIFKGSHTKFTRYVEIIKANKLIYKNKKEIKLNIDGEIIDVNGDIIFEIDDHKLEVIFR